MLDPQLLFIQIQMNELPLSSVLYECFFRDILLFGKGPWNAEWWIFHIFLKSFIRWALSTPFPPTIFYLLSLNIWHRVWMLYRVCFLFSDNFTWQTALHLIQIRRELAYFNRLMHISTLFFNFFFFWIQHHIRSEYVCIQYSVFMYDSISLNLSSASNHIVVTFCMRENVLCAFPARVSYPLFILFSYFTFTYYSMYNLLFRFLFVTSSHQCFISFVFQSRTKSIFIVWMCLYWQKTLWSCRVRNILVIRWFGNLW